MIKIFIFKQRHKTAFDIYLTVVKQRWLLNRVLSNMGLVPLSGKRWHYGNLVYTRCNACIHEGFKSLVILECTFGIASQRGNEPINDMTTGIILPMRQRQARAFTMIEIILIIAVLGVLAQLAVSSYTDYIERARVSQAVSDIAMISTLITQYERENGSLPPDLAAVGNGNIRDPWGRPYQYLDLSAKGAAKDSRRDRNLNPLNTDFDLYSLGKDGISQKQISNKDSLDDVVRANDGAFINLASKYTR